MTATATAAGPEASASFAVIVLAGGAARRLGGVHKPALELGGRSLLDHVLAGLPPKTRTVVVGLPQPAGPAVTFTREDPPGGGPVAGVAAGLAHVREEVVVLLAGDMPFAAPAVPVLVSAVVESSTLDGVLLVDPEGREQPLAGAYRSEALRRRLREIGEPAGASLRRLLAGLSLRRLPDGGGWTLDCDTWADVRAARQRWEAEHAR